MKKSSSVFIKENNLSRYPFKWQGGYGAFSYSKSHADRVVRYVLNQKTHHQKKTFQKEYMALLKAFEIAYKDAYLFDFFE